MKRIALKIDVDTYPGARTGAPALAELLQHHDAQATFFFSLGPDQSGRDSSAESLKFGLGLPSRLYGRALPAPNIGARCRVILKSIGDAGFETGVRAWNRVRWEQQILTADNCLAEIEMDRAYQRFQEVFGAAPSAIAAPGWRASRHVLRLEQRKGFQYASDCRGSCPFLPVVEGESVACVQIPTTLPTLDELMSVEPGLTPDQAMERVLQLSRAIPGDHVFTLRAELEGMKFLAPFERLLTQWQTEGCSLVTLRQIRETLDLGRLETHSVKLGNVPGRKGRRLLQGDPFPTP